MISLDTNVLVYVVDDRDPAKQAVAREALGLASATSCALALQVVGELQQVLRRKLKMPPWIAAQTCRNLLAAFPTFAADAAGAEEALGQMATGRLSYWDALLLTSARSAGCTALISEDLHDGATMLGLEIVNPFGREGLSDRARELLSGA